MAREASLSMRAVYDKVAVDMEAARSQLRECEKAFQRSDYHRADGDFSLFDAEKDALKYRLRQACTSLITLLELLHLPLLHQRFLLGWGEFEGKLDDVGHQQEDPEWLYSEPLIYLAEVFESVSAGLSFDEGRAADLALLERILRLSPHILHDAGVIPGSEAQVRKPIFNVLKTVFPDIKAEVPIPQISKTYRADFGIPDLGACVEFKFADGEQELKAEIDGVFADMRGYSGSAEWKHFFAVFYTCQPTMAHERIVRLWKQVSADHNWTPIVVHGPGGRQRKLRKPKPPGST
jgi:hypothetical protein